MWNIKPSIECTVVATKGSKHRPINKNKSEKVAWVHNQISAGHLQKGGRKYGINRKRHCGRLINSANKSHCPFIGNTRSYVKVSTQVAHS